MRPANHPKWSFPWREDSRTFVCMLTDSEAPFGWQTTVGLYGCDCRQMMSVEQIERFVIGLCDDVLLMRRRGAPVIEQFNGDEFSAAGNSGKGFSVVQLFETSSLVGHFSCERRTGHIDVFSCNEYDSNAIAAFSTDFFAATVSASSVVARH